MKKCQFSKLIVVICIILSILSIFLATIFSIIGLSEMIASAIITVYGCMGITSIVWYLKKAQSENTVKIYLGAYKEILSLKAKAGEDGFETINQMETEILGKLNSNISTAMDEANAPIERQDIY